MDIEQAVQDFRAERARQEQARIDRQAREEEERKTKKTEVFQNWIDTSFSAEMKAVLQLGTIELEYAFDDPVLTFNAVGRTFRMRLRVDNYGVVWVTGDMRFQSHSLVHDDLSLIAVFADILDQEAAYLQRDAAVKEEHRAASEATAATLEMHQRCLARIERFRAAIVPWEWPRFREIEIAHWRWCTAPAVDGGEPEYNDGYSLQHRIYENGKLKLEAERHKPHTARTVVLPESAIPIASITIVTRLAELPEPLVQHRTGTVSGIREDYSQHDAEGKPLLIEDETAVMKIELPERWPVAWVRDALTR